MPIRNYPLLSRASVQILTVNPSKQIVEGSLSDQSKIAISVWDTPPAFRWPQVGEIWTVRRDAGKPWSLGNRVIDVSTLAKDSLLLDSSNIVDSQGRKVPVKQAFSLGAVTAGLPISIVHDLGTQDICVSIYTVATGVQVFPSTTFIDANTIHVTFTSSSPANTYRAVIIG